MTDAETPSTLRRRLSVPVHPFLFTAYAVLFLWSQNVGKVVPREVLLPLAAGLVGTAVVYGAARVLFRAWGRAAIVTTSAVVLFFGYGHVLDVMNGRTILGVKIGETKLLGLWAVLAVATIAVVVLVKTSWRGLSYLLNVVLSVLIVMALVGVVTGSRSAPAAPARSDDIASGGSRPTRKPDIYYFIFDRYAGGETLQQYYDFDNESFLDSLRDRGFYVADQTRGNYPKTPHSLAASLNMRYLDDLPEASSDWRIVYNLLPGNRVVRFLKDEGYQYVFVASKYHALLADPLADVTYSYEGTGAVWTGFSQALYESTLLAAVGSEVGVAALDTRKQDYSRTLYQLNTIPEARKIEGPTFTFAHFYLPHEPYIFDADGRYVTKEQQDAKDHRAAYIEQLRFTNREIAKMIDKLLDVPENDRPIIILQSDEGPGPEGWNPGTPEHYDWTKAPQQTLEEKFRLLNAYLLPDIGDRHPPGDITPVNSFRWLLSTYFGADLAPLEDRSYIFRNELEPYRFDEVTERVKD